MRYPISFYDSLAFLWSKFHARSGTVVFGFQPNRGLAVEIHRVTKLFYRYLAVFADLNCWSIQKSPRRHHEEVPHIMTPFGGQFSDLSRSPFRTHRSIPANRLQQSLWSNRYIAMPTTRYRILRHPFFISADSFKTCPGLRYVYLFSSTREKTISSSSQ